MSILSRLFSSGSDDHEHARQKREKFQELERLHAGDDETISYVKAVWLTSRGLHYARLGSFDYAIPDFKEAIALKPDQAEAFLGLGISYANKGMLQEALCVLKSAPKKWKLHRQEYDIHPRTIQEINNFIRELNEYSSKHK